MNFEDFKKATDLLSQKELDKVLLLAFFHRKVNEAAEFSATEAGTWMHDLDLPRPNVSRLALNLKRSRNFVKGSKSSNFKLHAAEVDRLQGLYPGLRSGSTEVAEFDTILPKEIYENTRGFIELLARQIDASYEYNIFDGCAMLMRRLLEVLLILTYEHLAIENQIQEADGSYKNLSTIINDAKAEKKLKLTKDMRKTIDSFRLLGNHSAHKVYYNCRMPDLEKVSVDYRVLVEHLLYQSGVKT
ncbi:hypothetical protein QEH59_18255 [Coraliomargarita sp. SDUM461004]|uniref:DUF4145 domain-containing protein n=1 Tax=Thalassobacterium sedimentorum TaxID=3041258 RepID=A0ABU1ANQ4_9BACT|nr:hypothetical protein [Coraliomargarita sp. SDUM461004]MDQ8196379.1 hypothetical protein [Coraliomargarita sp. SDUM461004]